MDPPVERDVPFRDVVALEEMPVEVLALDRTVELEVEDPERAELELTLRDVFAFTGDSSEVVAAEVERLEPEDAFSSPFPELADEPAPAPEEEPALFDATVTGAVLTELD